MRSASRETSPRAYRLRDTAFRDFIVLDENGGLPVEGDVRRGDLQALVDRLAGRCLSGSRVCKVLVTARHAIASNSRTGVSRAYSVDTSSTPSGNPSGSPAIGPGSANASSAVRTAAGVASGCVARYSVAPPATIGEEKLVPDSTL
jgi:hypothetical protein